MWAVLTLSQQAAAGLLATLAWVAWAAVIALCVGVFITLAPDAVEDDPHGDPHGDCFPTFDRTSHDERNVRNVR